MESNTRLLSLDVFRGLTMALMVLVNNAGGLPDGSPLTHAAWNGCTPTDLVFPFFLFIVGIAITFSLTKRKEAGENVYRKILTRTAWIVGIGIFLNGAPGFDFASWRIPGVLTRIGIVYGIASLIFMKTTTRQLVWIAIGCLLSYWALMTLVPVPGQGFPSLEEGKDLGAWLDRLLLPGHLYGHTSRPDAGYPAYDPESILGTISSLATCLGGILAGTWLRKKQDDLPRWAGLFAVGSLLILGGLLWGEAFPINKKLWTSSYVLYHSGLALLTLCTVWWVVDFKGKNGWTAPFVWLGVNPLAIYLSHEILAIVMWSIPVGDSSLYDWVRDTIFGWMGHNMSVFFNALLHVVVNTFIAWVLYKKKIFIRV
ncbi:MAG: heparan-alpha-glucosaminide N-acetyltransferase domain-containing protein [Bacteroidales bacterium]|nr:heparan-alpha-glucosaminide N-acetyltransferase domain-containing protein [Bacteroidales bacterium]